MVRGKRFITALEGAEDDIFTGRTGKGELYRSQAVQTKLEYVGPDVRVEKEDRGGTHSNHLSCSIYIKYYWKQNS